MASFLTVFKNGGENYSFGRVFAGLSLVVCLSLLVFAVYSDYHTLTKPVIMSETNQAGVLVQKTVLVPQPDWSGYDKFMTGTGILAGTIYGLSKLLGAGQTMADGYKESKTNPPKV